MSRYPWHVHVGKGTTIEENFILGYNNLTKLRPGYEFKETEIGEGVLIRPGCIVYSGCRIGNYSTLNQNVILREFTEIGNFSSIGSLSMCEGYTKIGDHVTVHSQCHLTARMVIEDFVFIGPGVTTANDKSIRYHRPKSTGEDIGPYLERGCAIGAGAVLLPGIKIGRGSIIGAGAVVTKDIPEYTVAYGCPAQLVRKVRDDETIE